MRPRTTVAAATSRHSHLTCWSDFSAAALGRRRVADITYVDAPSGFVYPRKSSRKCYNRQGILIA